MARTTSTTYSSSSRRKTTTHRTTSCARNVTVLLLLCLSAVSFGADQYLFHYTTLAGYNGIRASGSLRSGGGQFGTGLYLTSLPPTLSNQQLVDELFLGNARTEDVDYVVVLNRAEMQMRGAVKLNNDNRLRQGARFAAFVGERDIWKLDREEGNDFSLAGLQWAVLPKAEAAMRIQAEAARMATSANMSVQPSLSPRFNVSEQRTEDEVARSRLAIQEARASRPAPVRPWTGAAASSTAPASASSAVPATDAVVIRECIAQYMREHGGKAPTADQLKAFVLRVTGQAVSYSVANVALRAFCA